VEGVAAFVLLHGVFFSGGDVAGVLIGVGDEDNVLRGDVEGAADGFTEAASGHGGDFGGE